MRKRFTPVILSIFAGCFIAATAIAGPATDEATTNYNEGTRLLLAGQFRAAIPYFDKAISLQANYTNAYYNRGKAYEGLGEYQPAMADYTRVIQLQPAADAYNNRGRCKYMNKDFNGALADFTKAAQTDPQFALAFGNRAIVLFKLGRDAEAQKELSRCYQLDSSLKSTYDPKVQTILNSRNQPASTSTTIRTDAVALRIQWHSDLYTTYQEALEQGKPLVVFFYMKGGAMSSKVENEIFASKEVNRLADRALFVRVDAEAEDKGGNVAKMQKELGIKQDEYPTTVVLDVAKDHLKERGRVIGYYTLDEFYSLFSKLLINQTNSTMSKR